MVLRAIKAAGIKGQLFEYSLGPATAIVGPNFGGKTAILEAIKFICRGRFPEVKKGSWPEARVVGEFDEGILTRSINAKGWVTTAGTLAATDLDVPLMDPSYYPGLTDRERTNYVFGKVKLPDSYSGESISADITRLSLGEEHTEEVEKAKGDIITELRELFVNRPKDMTLQEALGQAVEKCRTRFTYWNRRCKETQGAVKTLTELKLREKNFSAESVTLDAEIKELEKQAMTVNQDLGALRQSLRSAEQQSAQKKSIESWLASDRTDYPRQLEQLRAKRNELAQEFERTSDAVMGYDIDEMRKAMAGLRADAEAAGREVAVATKAKNEAVKGLKDLEALTECPYCHGSPKGWRKTLQDALEDRRDEAALTIANYEELIEKRRDDMVSLGKTIETFEQTRAKAEQQRQGLKRLGDEIDRILEDQAKDDKKRKDLTEQIAKLEYTSPAELETIKSKIAGAEKALIEVTTSLQLMNETRTAETKLKQDLVRAAEASKEHDIAAAQLLVTKRVGKLLDEKREAMVCEVFQKLLTTANVFTKGILKSPLVLQDNTIGRFEGSTFVEHYWFSETEKILTYSAIAVALSADAPIKLVLIDEIGRLDDRNQEAVINRLGAMLGDGVIHQFIVAGTKLVERAPDLSFPLEVIDLYGS